MTYKTRQSALILQVLEENRDRHLTAEEIYLLLKERGEPVGQTTVYRHLEKLCADATVRKYAGGDGDSACFQLADAKNCKMHYHLKCTACGRLFHTECAYLNTLSEHIKNEHGFLVDSSKTVLYGLCKTCAKEKQHS